MSFQKHILLWIFIINSVFLNTLKSQSLLDTLDLKLNSDISIKEKLAAIKESANTLLFSSPDTMVYFSNYALRMTEVTKSKSDKIYFLGILGDAHYKLSNYSEALKANFEACKLCEELKDTFELAHAYNSIGSIYRVSNKLDEAKIYFEKSIHLREATKDSVGLAANYNNIGIIYMMTSKYDTGMDYWSRSMVIKLAIGDSVGAATTMSNMAMYYRDIGETEKALDYLHKALEIKQRVKDHSSISMAYLNLGELYIKQGKQQKGENYYLMALEEAKISKTKQLESWVHHILAETYYEAEKYKKAYDHFLLNRNLQDTIFNEETSKNLEVVESKYQNEKKALQIKNLEEAQKIQDEKQQLILVSAGTGIFALLIIVLIISKNYRQKKRDNMLITEQKAIVDEKNKEITDSITYARRLQEAILPPNELIKEKLNNSFILFKPKDVVSGDFYWLEAVNDHIIFAVADCTGHGVPGAMVSVVCSNALNRTVKEFNIIKPSEILDKVRALVIETFEKSTEDVKDGMDIAICSLNIKTKSLEYAGANNPLWILKKESEEIEEIKANKQPIGVYHDFAPFTNHKISLNEGDSIYLFSDGYADQFGGDKGKKLKYKPFKDLLIKSSKLELSKQKEILLEEFEKWKGDIEQVDDVCVMGIII